MLEVAFRLQKLPSEILALTREEFALCLAQLKKERKPK